MVYNVFFKNIKTFFFIWFLFIIFFSLNNFAQDTSRYKSIQYPIYAFEVDSINPKLNSPSSGHISYRVEFDTVTNKYYLYYLANGVKLFFPTQLTQDEYFALSRKINIKSYWSWILNASPLERAKNRKYYTVGNYNFPGAKALFGGGVNTSGGGVQGGKLGVDAGLDGGLLNFDPLSTVFNIFTKFNIRLTGYWEVKLGFRYSVIENPFINFNARRRFVPIIEQDANLDLKVDLGANIAIDAALGLLSLLPFQNKFKIKYEPLSLDPFNLTTFDKAKLSDLDLVDKELKDNALSSFIDGEDGIIRSIEIGDVQMKSTNDLITDAGALFGAKFKLQFGKLNLTTVFSQSNTNFSEFSVPATGQVNKFDIKASNYDVNRHYFIGHYFRNNYETFLQDLPLIKSKIKILKIELWVLNTGASVENSRNFVAFTDLGEFNPQSNIVKPITSQYPNTFSNRDQSNDLYNNILGGYLNFSGERSLNNVNTALTNLGFVQGQDFEIVQRGKILDPKEFTYMPDLGYVSLIRKLRDDEVLAVAYQYQIDGEVYQVGEFANENLKGNQPLVLKLLKSTQNITTIPLWNLMMKNIYFIGASGIDKNGFDLDVFYTNKSNNSDVNYLSGINDINVNSIPLLRLLNLDRLNKNNTAEPDGTFDYIQNYTINEQRGLIIFPYLEPFGSSLTAKFSDKNEADKVNFPSLYNDIQANAVRDFVKDRFKMKGSYKSVSSSNSIDLRKPYIAQGSVQVFSGGQTLNEGSDFTVDYNSGIVNIINPIILNSGKELKVRLQNFDISQTIQKNFLGFQANYRVNKDLQLNGSFYLYDELNLSNKINYGNEPARNILWGVDGTYFRNSNFLTTMIDKIPLISVKEPSNVSLKFQFAHLAGLEPLKTNGTEVYLEDFEGSSSVIELKYFQDWKLSSIPSGQNSLFPNGDKVNDLKINDKRAKLAWYSIDNSVFYGNQSNITSIPTGVTKEQQSNDNLRQILERELFPLKDFRNTFITPVISTFDLAYFPSEKGPYNFNTTDLLENGELANPEENWAGIMRAIDNPNLENSRIEYLEFWMMDPFNKDNPNQDNSGKIYLNLGNISEDILKDNYKSIENAIPTDGNTNFLHLTEFGKIYTIEPATNTFQNSTQSRAIQDVGLDGLSTKEEEDYFKDKYLSVVAQKHGTQSMAYLNAINDPSNDNYRFYRGDYYDSRNAGILERYKDFNNTEGNTPTIEQSNTSYSSIATPYPDNEDINKDNTMNQNEGYYQYEISVSKSDFVVGKNYIINEVTGDGTLSNGEPITTKWYLFRVPLSDGKVIGSNVNFNSIRFMRFLLKGFSKNIVFRFARLGFVRNLWSKYNNVINIGTENGINSGGNLNVNTVGIEQSGSKNPIPYKIPNGVTRRASQGTQGIQYFNEEAISIKYCDLLPNESKAIFKNTNFNLLPYKNLKFYAHAESGGNVDVLENNEVAVFIRIGEDVSQNYYEIEMPLEVTRFYAENPSEVWPQNNVVQIALEKLSSLKLNRKTNDKNNLLYEENFGRGKIRVFGFPRLDKINSTMIGIRNVSNKNICAEVWVNELSVNQFQDNSGVAAKVSGNIKLSDFGDISFNGDIKTSGFGAVNQKISNVDRSDQLSYNLDNVIQLGKFFPKKLGVKLPINFGFSDELTAPIYAQRYGDIRISDINNANINQAEKNDLILSSETYRSKRYINLNNATIGKLTKNRFYDPTNLTFTYIYNVENFRSPEIESQEKATFKNIITYNYNPTPLVVYPFRINEENLEERIRKLDSIKKFNIYRKDTVDRFFKESKESSKREEIINKLSPKIERLKKILELKSRGAYRRFKRLKEYDTLKKYNDRNIMESNLGEQVKELEKLRKMSNYYEKEIDKIKNYKPKLIPYKELIKDFNISIFPVNISIQSDINRLYNQFKKRNNSEDTIKTPYIYDKSYTWDRYIRINHDLTKSIKYSFSAVTKTVIDEPIGAINDAYNDKVFENFVNLGRNIKYDHNISFSYNPPFEKIPILSWLNAKYTYTGNFSWTAAPKGLEEYGHRISNAGNYQVSASFSFIKIFSGLGFSLTNRTRINNRGNTVNKSKANLIFSHIFNILKVGTIDFTLNETNSIDGFLLIPDFRGVTVGKPSPGINYLLGFSDKNFLRNPDNIDNITISHVQNKYFTFSEGYVIKATLSIEPFRFFRIDFNLDWNKNLKSTEGFDIFDKQVKSYGVIDNGNISYTYPFIFSGLDKIENVNSASNEYKTFENNLYVFSEFLSKQNPNSLQIPRTDNFYDGYGKSQQDVLVRSFFSAYTGIQSNSVNDILDVFPLPNWRFSYSGLSYIKGLRKFFRSIIISHNYSSKVEINSFNSQTHFINGIYRDQNQNFYPNNEIKLIRISENFNPLAKISFGFNNGISFALTYNKSRSLDFSLSAFQITELNRGEIVTGFAYTVPPEKINFIKIKKLKNSGNMTIKLDFTYREDNQVVRKIFENLHQTIAGKNSLAIKFNVDYSFTKFFTSSFYITYDEINPYVSTSYPNSSFETGLKFRFDLGTFSIN